MVVVHTLLDRSGHIFREQRGAVAGREEFLQPVAVRARHLDVKSLELALECVVPGKLGAAVLLRRVQALQRLAEALRALVKILGNGELTKKLTVQANAFSAKAAEKIEALGGKAEVI